MKLESFSATNFRSITKASTISFGEGLTTLIGPNNEGKSNVLRALVTALELASRLDEITMLRGGRLRGLRLGEGAYNWATDFPVSLQKTSPNGMSYFDLDFALSPSEVADFRSEVGSSLNGALPIRIGIGNGEPTFRVRKKRGRGAAALAGKSARIAKFIGKRIEIQYIPAVRTASAALTVVERMVARDLAALSENPEYIRAIEAIDALQAPVLERLGDGIRSTLRVFLPDVTDVQVRVPREARYRALTHSCEVVVNDGEATTLSRKGDGVQSLAALSLLRQAAQAGKSNKQLILAIEEPESHLHPMAIHQLRSVLNEIASEHQVIITTHCPLFVDRGRLFANILVSGNRARPAASIREIRDILGVRVSDNLTAAEVMLLVEGETDRTALMTLLPLASEALRSALSQGVLAIESLLGSGKLSYKLAQTREAMCAAHVLLDKDQAGDDAYENASQQKLLTIADVTHTHCPGMRQSEFEDWYDPSLVATLVSTSFGIPEHSPHFARTNAKWSQRMEACFLSAGKPWNASTEGMLKACVSGLAGLNGLDALHPARRSAFDALVESLERKLRR